MAKRIVTATSKDKDGDITELCTNIGWWGKVTKEQAIDDIESGTYEYYARGEFSPRDSKIEVVNGHLGKYLRTVRDGIQGNNLDELRDCYY